MQAEVNESSDDESFDKDDDGKSSSSSVQMTEEVQIMELIAEIEDKTKGSKCLC